MFIFPRAVVQNFVLYPNHKWTVKEIKNALIKTDHRYSESLNKYNRENIKEYFNIRNLTGWPALENATSNSLLTIFENPDRSSTIYKKYNRVLDQIRISNPNPFPIVLCLKTLTIFNKKSIRKCCLVQGAARLDFRNSTKLRKRKDNLKG